MSLVVTESTLVGEHYDDGAPIRVSRALRFLPSNSDSRLNPLAGPRVVSDNEHKEPKRELWMTEPAENSCGNVTGDSEDRPTQLKPEADWR